MAVEAFCTSPPSSFCQRLKASKRFFISGSFFEEFHWSWPGDENTPLLVHAKGFGGSIEAVLVVHVIGSPFLFLPVVESHEKVLDGCHRHDVG